MKNILIRMTQYASIAFAATATFFTASSSSAAELKAGDPAPEFKLVGSDGETYSLADFKGEQAVVLAWFPKAFTGGCTAECKSFRDSGEAIREYDVAYFTASCDTVDLNTKFAASLDLDYPILSDPDGDVARAYGVIDDSRKVPYRWTFYIGADGNILAIEKDVQTKTHGEDVAAKLDELGVPKK